MAVEMKMKSSPVDMEEAESEEVETEGVAEIDRKSVV